MNLISSQLCRLVEVALHSRMPLYQSTIKAAWIHGYYILILVEAAQQGFSELGDFEATIGVQRLVVKLETVDR